MKRKEERTLFRYKLLGAEMRLLKTLASRVYADSSAVLSSHDRDAFHKAINIIHSVCSNAEDRMFKNFPGLEREYARIFYGATDIEARDSLEKSILTLAKGVADSLFCDK